MQPNVFRMGLAQTEGRRPAIRPLLRLTSFLILHLLMSAPSVAATPKEHAAMVRPTVAKET